MYTNKLLLEVINGRISQVSEVDGVKAFEQLQAKGFITGQTSKETGSVRYANLKATIKGLAWLVDREEVALPESNKIWYMLFDLSSGKLPASASEMDLMLLALLGLVEIGRGSTRSVSYSLTEEGREFMNNNQPVL